jgi:hypothetical protein
LKILSTGALPLTKDDSEWFSVISRFNHWSARGAVANMVTEVLVNDWDEYLDEIGQVVGFSLRHDFLADGILPAGLEPPAVYVTTSSQFTIPSVGSVTLNDAAYDMVKSLRTIRGGQPVRLCLGEFVSQWLKVNKGSYTVLFGHMAKKHQMTFQDYFDKSLEDS